MTNNNPDKVFQSFIGNLEHDAEMAQTETPGEHASRLLDEVVEVLNAGIQSQEEATSLLAKLDIVIEAAENPVIKAAANTFKADIKNRFPGIVERTK